MSGAGGVVLVVVDLQNDFCDASAAARHGGDPAVLARAAGAAAGVVAQAGAVPSAGRVPVPVDLRGDWAAALLGAGLRPGLPTAWLAEGLLLYLPASAERRLIAIIDELSASGSMLGYEVKLLKEARAVRDSPVYAEARERLGVDLLALFDGDPRPDSAADLAGRGWRTEVGTPYDHVRRYGRGPRPEPDDALAANRWVFAVKGAAGVSRW
ncbi:SAM-dependent methyltransferase [Streptomyces bauhiniae]|uniref:SAM-dependent methyltransferase n=1 Tax=Streptomyces bauhiniae TaxID=2340725 RepID=UPI00332661DC